MDLWEPHPPTKVTFSFCRGQLLLLWKMQSKPDDLQVLPLGRTYFPHSPAPTSQAVGMGRALQSTCAPTPQPLPSLGVTDKSELLCWPVLESKLRLACHSYL